MSRRPPSVRLPRLWLMLNQMIKRVEGRAGARATGAPAWVGVGLGTALASVLAATALFDDGRVDPLWKERLAFVGLVSLPPLLATIGCLGRPRLVLAAGVVSFPLAAFFLISVAGLPLLIPAVFYLWGYRGELATPPRAPVSVAVLTMVAFLAAAWVALTVHRDPVCWERRTLAGSREVYTEWRPEASTRTWQRSRNFSGSSPTVLNVERGCERDRIIWWEFAAAGALVAAAVALPAYLATPSGASPDTTI